MAPFLQDAPEKVRVSNAIPFRGSDQGITRISRLSEGASKLSPSQDANEADHIGV